MTPNAVAIDAATGTDGECGVTMAYEDDDGADGYDESTYTETEEAVVRKKPVKKKPATMKRPASMRKPAGHGVSKRLRPAASAPRDDAPPDADVDLS